MRLLPDLEMGTIKALQRLVPDFKVPTVPVWFGIGRKVAPHVTLDSLRIKLGAHLDNTKDEVPACWKDQVISIDVSIRDLQENLIRSNAERITDISMRIAALQKFLHVDVTKMNPRVRKQLEQATTSLVKFVNQPSRSYHSFRNNVTVNNNNFDSSSDPSLLEMWLWWQILTPNSECSQEVHRIETGGGDFGGAGASGGWDERPDTTGTSTEPLPPSVSVLSLSTTQEGSPNQSEEEQLAVQAELGSQSFS